jgi:hypothetical protein
MTDPDRMLTYNDLYVRIGSLIEAINNPPGAVAAVPRTAPGPFFRMGEPLLIPVSPNSAAVPFTVVMPPNSTTFQFTNNNPFAVRLCGTRVDQDFVMVTGATGWLWMPGTQGIRTTLNPKFLSVMSVDGPYAATSPDQKAGTGFIELQYGTGS